MKHIKTSFSYYQTINHLNFFNMAEITNSNKLIGKLHRHLQRTVNMYWVWFLCCSNALESLYVIMYVTTCMQILVKRNMELKLQVFKLENTYPENIIDQSLISDSYINLYFNSFICKKLVKYLTYIRSWKSKMKELQKHGCSPVNLPQIFRTPFPRNTSRWLLLELLSL